MGVGSLLSWPVQAGLQPADGEGADDEQFKQVSARLDGMRRGFMYPAACVYSDFITPSPSVVHGSLIGAISMFCVSSHTLYRAYSLPFSRRMLASSAGRLTSCPLYEYGPMGSSPSLSIT